MGIILIYVLNEGFFYKEDISFMRTVLYVELDKYDEWIRISELLTKLFRLSTGLSSG